jgi:GNAT superfamily N-acetyltransferase
VRSETPHIEKDKINYRRATTDDIEILIDFRIRFLNELYNHPENEESKALRPALRQYFSQAISDNDFIAWLAEYDGKTIGTSGMVVWRLPSRYGGLEAGRLGYILNMFTIPEARNKGICTRLLKELIKEAQSLGLKYVHLHASVDGMNIYKKAGFVRPELVELELKLEGK